MKKFNDFVLPEKTKVSVAVQKKKSANNDVLTVDIQNIPKSIAQEIKQKACELVTENLILKGFGSSYYVRNDIKEDEDFRVIYDESVKKPSLKCTNSKCHQFKCYGICAHSLAVATYLGIIKVFVQSCNSKKAKINLLADFNKEANAGRKKSKSTQRRKGSAKSKSTPVQFYVSPVRVNSTTNGGAVAPPSTTTTTTTATSATTTSTPTAAKTSVSTNTPPTTGITKNLVNQPSQPDPAPHCYQLTLLKCCHKNVTCCYGCGGRYGKPEEPDDLIVASKTKRIYVSPKSKELTQSPDFTRVYYHLKQSCLSKYDNFFTFRQY